MSPLRILGVESEGVTLGSPPIPLPPVGTGIIFVKDVILFGGTWEIHNCAADGSGLTVLTSDTNNYVSCVWSPDGTHILSVDDVGSVWIMNCDGTGLTEITNCQHGSGIVQDQGAWSPDGTQFALPAAFGGDIQIINADNSDFSLVTVVAGNFNSGQIYWSPDGTKFAYNDTSSPRGGVSTCHIDGTSSVPIIESTASPDWGFTVQDWYSDSTNLLVAGSEYVTPFDEVLLKTDGTTTTTLYSDPGPSSITLGGYVTCLNDSDDSQIAWRNNDSTAGVTTFISGTLNNIGPGDESIGEGLDWR